MTPRAELQTVGASEGVATLVAFHACRSETELVGMVADRLARDLVGVSFALCSLETSGGVIVDAVVGDACPWRSGDRVQMASWERDDDEQLPVHLGDRQIGAMLADRGLTAAERGSVSLLLEHFATARINLALGAEAQHTAESYCASLQALEEAVVLFQEGDPSVVQARLLSLASSLLHATAAALYVLHEVGNVDSGLFLASALGIPEDVLETFRAADGGDWPEGLLGQQVELCTRDESGGLAGLDPETVLPILQNIVVLPLRYHGVDAGICVLFNAEVDETRAEGDLRRVQSLGQLGAALLHRLQLESIAVRNRALAKELQIAETIQKQLMPAEAPEIAGCEFAWSSVAAEYIGGDYLDVIPATGGAVVGVVADVSGHGVNSALLMSSFRSTYRAECRRVALGTLAAELNAEVAREVGQTGMFITCAMFELSGGGRRMLITSAGHNPVLIYRARSRSVDQVDAFGPPLGLFPGIDYGQADLKLAPGDVVLLYTDGVTEAMVPGGEEMFSEERLEELLIAVADESAESIVGHIRDSLVQFTGVDQFEDDVSILVAKTTPTDVA